MTRIDYDTPVTTLAGEQTDLRAYQDKVLLVVNTASKCGFTPQYKGLQELHERFGDQGLSVLGFPCDQFAHQEPGGEAEIAEFCELNYGVTFPLHAKIKVNGRGTHPLFETLKKAARGPLRSQRIMWNFTKFLVARDGTVLKRYSSKIKPRDIVADIEQQLAVEAAA